METTKNKLTPEQGNFLKNLGNYLDTKLFYYGSIQRDDYVSGKSDIDVDIFTDNEMSTIHKMQHFLHVQKSDFKKIIWKLRNNKLITGYKIKYSNDFINAEFAIYNEKYKQDILREHNSKNILPFYCTFLLNVLKIMYYHLHILPTKYYAYLKRKIFSYGCGFTSEEKFLVL